MTNYGGANGYGKAISFSSKMVRAICEGNKTQTRRIIKPQPGPFPEAWWPGPEEDKNSLCWGSEASFKSMSGARRKAPYQVCDELRIRETDLWVKITDVRVERVQDISEEDAKAEGAERMALDDLGGSWRTHKRGFQSLWESIYGEGPWEANPWVWVYEFRRMGP